MENLKSYFPGGIFHVIQKGVEDRDIFIENEDYKFYLKELKDGLLTYNISLLSYALLKNHTHLLIKLNDLNLSNFMHKIGNNYSHYFNAKYFRRGHLFSGRYKRKTIKNESYLISVIRYINLNPLTSGLTNNLNNYLWCSYKELINNKKELIDFKTLEEILPIDISKLKDEIIVKVDLNEDFKDSSNDLDYYIDKIKLIKEKYEDYFYNKNFKDSIIFYLSKKGLSARKISLILNSSHTYISQRIKKCSEMVNKDQSFVNWVNKIELIFKKI